MTGPMRVDATTLYAAAKDARSTHHSVEAVQRTMNTVTAEAASRWKGMAASGFQDVMARWSNDVTTVLNALNQIADLLDTSAARHLANDEAQQQHFNRYDSSLQAPTS